MENSLTYQPSLKIDPRRMGLLAAMLAIAFAVIIYGQHATARHGGDADLVRQCMEDQGPTAIWVMPDGRVENVCKLADGRWGIMVTDGFHEVTSFIKSKMTRLSQVEQYLRNMGAMRVSP